MSKKTKNFLFIILFYNLLQQYLFHLKYPSYNKVYKASTNGCTNLNKIISKESNIFL